MLHLQEHLLNSQKDRNLNFIFLLCWENPQGGREWSISTKNLNASSTKYIYSESK